MWRVLFGRDQPIVSCTDSIAHLVRNRKSSVLALKCSNAKALLIGQELLFVKASGVSITNANDLAAIDIKSDLFICGRIKSSLSVICDYLVNFDILVALGRKHLLYLDHRGLARRLDSVSIYHTILNSLNRDHTRLERYLKDGSIVFFHTLLSNNSAVQNKLDTFAVSENTDINFIALGMMIPTGKKLEHDLICPPSLVIIERWSLHAAKIDNTKA